MKKIQPPFYTQYYGKSPYSSKNTPSSPIQGVCTPHITQQEAQDIFLEAYYTSPEKAQSVLQLYKDILHVAQNMKGD